MEDNSGVNPLEGLDLSVLFNKSNNEDSDNTILNPIPKEDDLKNHLDDEDEDENEDDSSDLDDDNNDDDEDLDKDDNDDDIKMSSNIKSKSNNSNKKEENNNLDDDSDDNSNPINIFASMLAESGLIDYDESEEYDESKLVEAVENKIVSEIEAYKESLPSVIKDLINNYEEGVPLKELLEKEKSIEEYKSIDIDSVEDDENLQKKLVRDLLSKTGFDKDEIEERINDYEDSGILEKEAKRALNKLITLEEKEKEEFIKAQKEEFRLREQRYNEYITNLKNTIEKSEEFIPGLKVTKEEKRKLIEGIFKTDKNGKNAIVKARENDPNFDLKVAYAALILNWDFSKIEQKATTKATKKLAEAIKASDKLQKGISKKSNSSVDISIMEKIAKSKY